MLQAHARVIRTLDAEMQAEHGLALSAYEVLMFLGDAPGRRMRMAEIAARVLLTRSGCSRLVDRLAELRYVARCPAESDGRGLYAELTDAGAMKLAAARQTHRRGVRQHFLDRVTVTDQLALADIWTRYLRQDGAPPADRRPRGAATGSDRP